MKYSLKSKQFRKRNNIFGQRKRDQFGNQVINDQLEEIRELGESAQESKLFVDYGKNFRNSKISKFINFQTINQQSVPNKKIEQRKTSVQPRPGKHGLSPNIKPTYTSNVSNARVPEKKVDQTRKRKIQIKSEVVSFHFVGRRRSEADEELKEIVRKLYTIIVKNNQRINQIEALVHSMLQNGKLLMRQTNKGVQKAIKIQQKINLFTNTMRSVYENLRICKLKQQNIELYLKQQNKQNHSITTYEEQIKQRVQRPKYRLDDFKKQMTLSVQDLQSKQLISLVDFQSNTSEADSIHFQKSRPSFQRRSKHQFASSLTERQIIDKPDIENEVDFNEFIINQIPVQLPAKPTKQWEKLSPFQANRIISNTSHSRSISKYSNYSHNNSKYSNFQGSQVKNQQLQTFRTNNNAAQIYLESQKIKSWLKKLGLKEFKCWLDEMSCLRRPNMTYVFYQSGQVINLSKQCFNSLVIQGLLIPIYDSY